MAGNDSQSGTDNRLEIGAAVQRARDAGMTWKDIERRWGRDRSTLWRWAVVAAECNKIGTCCNIFGVDPATTDD